MDPTFNVTGIATTTITASNDVVNAVAVQPDGKIVAAGYSLHSTEFVLARYTTSGALDTAFGTGGIVRNGFESAAINAIALQSDGKIVVGGYIVPAAGGSRLFAVARYLPSGSLDTAFGSGGVVTTSIGSPFSGSEIYAILIQTDGRIVASGSAGSQFGTARYNSNGSLDTSFNFTGIVVTSFSGGSIPKAVKIQSDGKIVVAGETGSGTTTAVVRYTASGSLDSTFDSDGRVTTAAGAGSAMVIQADGKIVVATRGADYSLIRYNTNGSLDPGFGTNGIVTTSVGGFDSATGVALSPGGNILVTGYFEVSKTYDIFLSRYTSNGSLDPTFDGGGDGIVITDIGTFLDHSNAIALQPDGKIVVGGSLRNDTTGDDLAVLRYVGAVPTAANVILGGRIIDSNGYGVSGITVILNGGSLPVPHAAMTNAFGYYNFYDIPVGQTYIVTPESTRYTFSPTTQTISLMDEFLEANFTAN